MGEHGSLPCKRFQQLRNEVLFGKKHLGDQQSEGLVARNAKMCPSCQMPIQKDGGCNFMDCTHCRRHFCWSCGKILKTSHAKHVCDAGIEGSTVVSITPTGQACVELTRLYTNLLDIDMIELMNADEVDLADLKEMLIPGLTKEPRAPLFVGPSDCDGEVLSRLPFNFRKAMCWEITHILIKATHPPAPHAYPPRSVGVLPNVTNADFGDFEDPTALKLPLHEQSPGVFTLNLEQFRAKNTFRRITSLSLWFSTRAAPQDGSSDDGEHPDPEAQVFFNDIAIFGLPGDAGVLVGTKVNSMMDERANLIVSPVLGRKRWGEEVNDELDEKDEIDRSSDVGIERHKQPSLRECAWTNHHCNREARVGWADQCAQFSWYQLPVPFPPAVQSCAHSEIAHKPRIL